MARYPYIRLKISKFITPTDLQNRLLQIIGNDRVKKGVNEIIGDRANNYVPMKSGALRESIRVGPKTISWGKGLDYGGYQYRGQVYGPNIPIVRGGSIVGWFSQPGVKKHPTGRELGIPGEWKGWKFGYTTPGTRHHWVDKMLENDRRGMNIQITAYLKREARKRNK